MTEITMNFVAVKGSLKADEIRQRLLDEGLLDEEIVNDMKIRMIGQSENELLHAGEVMNVGVDIFEISWQQRDTDIDCDKSDMEFVLNIIGLGIEFISGSRAAARAMHVGQMQEL